MERRIAALLVLSMLAGGAMADDLPEHRTIILPETGMAAVLQDGQGIYLTYGEYRELWRRAHGVQPPLPVVPPPPVEKAFNACRVKVSATRDDLTMEAWLGINHPGPFPSLLFLPELPFFFTEAAWEDAPARFVMAADKPCLLVRSRSDTILYIKAKHDSARLLQGVVKVLLPDLPIRSLELISPPSVSFTCDREGAGIEPLVFQESLLCEPAPGSYLITWRKEGSGGIRRADPAFTAALLLTAGEDAVRADLVLDYHCPSLGPAAVAVGLPVGFDFHEARHPDLSGVTVAGDRLNLRFATPLRRTGRIEIALARTTAPPPLTIRIDGFSVEPAARLAFTVYGSGRQCEVFPLDSPAWQPTDPLPDMQFGMVRLSGGVPLDVSIRPVVNRLTGHGAITYYLNEYGIVFTSEWLMSAVAEVPAVVHVPLGDGSEVQSVTAGVGASRRRIDYTIGDGELSVHVPPDLRSSRLSLCIHGECREPPGGELALRGLAPREIARFEGTLDVYSSGDLTLAARIAEGLFASPVAAVPGAGGERYTQGLFYQVIDPDWRLHLVYGPAPTMLTGTVVSYITPGRLGYTFHASLRIDVTGAGIDGINLELPGRLGDGLQLDGPMIRERLLLTEGEDLDTWRLEFQDRLSGTFTLEIRYTRTREGDDMPDILLPRVPDAPELVHYVGIEGHDELEITSEPVDLREIDSATIPVSRYVPENRIIYAYKSVDTHPRLHIAVSSYDVYQGEPLLITSLDMETVIAGSGSEISSASLTLINNGEQYLRFTLPESYDLWSAVVDGEGVRPVRSGAKVLVPLRGEQGRRVSVQFVYAAVADSTWWRRWRPPAFDAPVLADMWTLYMPPERRTHVTTPMGIETGGRCPGFYKHSLVLTAYRMLLEVVKGLFQPATLLRSRMSSMSEPEDIRRKFGLDYRSGGYGNFKSTDAGRGYDRREEYDMELAVAPAPAMRMDKSSDAGEELVGDVPDGFVAGTTGGGKASHTVQARAADDLAQVAKISGGEIQRKGLSSLRIDLEKSDNKLIIKDLIVNKGTAGLISFSPFADRILCVFSFLTMYLSGLVLPSRGGISRRSYCLLMFVLLVFISVLRPVYMMGYLNSGVLAVAALVATWLGMRLASRRKRGVAALVLLAGCLSAGMAHAGGTLYVPYEGAPPAHVRDDDRVFLPEADFESLWRMAHPDLAPAVEPPVGYGMVSARIEGEVTGNHLAISGQVVVDVLVDDWVTITWPAWRGLGVAADGDRDVVKSGPESMEIALVGKGLHRISLAGRVPYEGTPELGAITTRLPSLPIGTMLIVLPGGEVSVSALPRDGLAAHARNGKTFV
ncbi:hypothetical protein JW905_16570, partial [bacterium]|nr:hypothetical protein [candidate division CSSED10-310 bacterium]